jgi:aminoglycoside phosphotransferase (APT) family kinase protein
VNFEGDGIGAALGRAWPELRLATPPEPLVGGYWATMYRLRVADPPPGVPADVVLRIAPHDAMGAKELAVQEAVAAQGYPTPPVYRHGPGGGPFGGPWAVMAFASGASPLDGLGGAAALRRAGTLVRALPEQLAGAMAALHRLDPAPVTTAVRAAAPSVAWHVDDVLAQLEHGADAVDRPEVAAALRSLARQRPAEPRRVVCHGDLHPFNVLAEGARVTVLDWTGSLHASPAYDVAFTTLLLAHPPLAVPGPVRAALAPAARAISRRFLRRYRAFSPDAALDELDWYTALHCARILVDAGAPGSPDAHPLQSLMPVAARRLGAATGHRIAAVR